MYSAQSEFHSACLMPGSPENETFGLASHVQTAFGQTPGSVCG